MLRMFHRSHGHFAMFYDEPVKGELAAIMGMFHKQMEQGSIHLV